MARARARHTGGIRPAYRACGTRRRKGQEMPEQRPNEGEHEYEQHITSPEHQEEHPGKGLITTNHDAIRQWAEKRDATPATVPGSEYEGRPGRLLFDFPGYGGESLVNISWDDWFETFDE